MAAIVLAVACWAGFAILTWLVTSGRTAAFDRAGIFVWRGARLEPIGPEWLTVGMRAVTKMGGLPVRSLFVTGTTIALLARRLPAKAAALAVGTTAGALICDAMKRVFAHARPDLVPRLVPADGFGYPSSHSFNAMLVYLLAALILASLSPRLAFRRAIIGITLVVIVLIAWSRVWLGVHYPSDVIAGCLGGAACVGTILAITSRPVGKPS